MNYWLFLIPLITAFTGWFVLWIAYTILFHPKKPVRILGLTIQGIYPKKQDQLASKLGYLISTEFFSFASIEQKISDPVSFEKIMPLIEDHVDDFLRNKLKEEMPMIGMFIGDKTIGQLKTIFLKEIATLFPEVMKKFAGSLQGELDIEKLVATKINGLPAEKLEAMLSQGLSKEMRLLGLAGAAIGLIAGLVQLAVIFATQ